jgi:two-component system chemotaxis sensor kinase CheA
MYANANETGLLLRELGRLGEMTVSLDDSALPDLDALNAAEEAYLIWTIDLTPPSMRPPCARCSISSRATATCPSPSARRRGRRHRPSRRPTSPLRPRPFDIAALLASAAAPPPVETPDARPGRPLPAPPAPLPKSSPLRLPPPSLRPCRARSRAPAAVAPVTIRVDLDRVDRLINVVGELVIQQAMLAQRVI